MIKFLVTNKRTNRITFGMVLTDGNLDYFKKGKPLHFHMEQLGMDELKCNEILVLYYPTNEEAVKDLTEKGYITPETKVQDIKTVKN